MLNHTIFHSPKRKAIFVVLLILMAAFIAVGARTKRIRGKALTPAVAPVSVRPVPAQAQSGRDHNMQVELITVLRHGFDRSAIIRPKGRFLLAVDNRSGLEEIDLKIVSESGHREREMKVHRKRPDWRGLVDLPTGNYRLTEARHSDWVCRITITAR